MIPAPGQPSLHMVKALALANSALYLTSPNPRVGCVLVDADGRILGEGHTQKAGEAHAEVMAIQDGHAKGNFIDGKAPKGSVAYVTLEPCAHQGRTGACAAALIQIGISKVVASVQDPNPLVAGKGFAMLRAAGIAVEIGDGKAEAQEMNIGFIHRMRTGVPWVRMKVAASLDGITALPNGHSQWITGQEARTDGHHWRARACAVLTGIGTVLADDPQLDVRHVTTLRQPILVLVDSKLEVPLTAQIFAAKRPVRIYTAANASHPTLAGKIKALQMLGAEIIALPTPLGKVDLTVLLRDLAQQHVSELHVEAGFKLNGSLWREGLVNEILLYQSAQLLGIGQGIVNLEPLQKLTDATRLNYHSVDRVGEDLRIILRLKINKIK